MTNYPKGSQAEQDVKNARLFRIIAIFAFPVFNIIAYALSSAPFGNLKAHPALWLIPVAGVTLLIVSVFKVGKSDWWEENKIGYIALLILTFASAVCIGGNPFA